MHELQIQESHYPENVERRSSVAGAEDRVLPTDSLGNLKTAVQETRQELLEVPNRIRLSKACRPFADNAALCALKYDL